MESSRKKLNNGERIKGKQVEKNLNSDERINGEQIEVLTTTFHA